MNCISRVTFSTLNILFINICEQNTKGKDQNNFKFACLELFKVVAKVASFVGNPVFKCIRMPLVNAETEDAFLLLQVYLLL